MDVSKVPTYHAGIAQSKAHRSIGVLVNGLLEKHQLTMLQWFILGLVYEAGREGARITDIAEQLDTSLAFVTNHINMLESRKLVTKSVSKKDTRAKIIVLAPSARNKVAKIEHELRGGMRDAIYKGIDPREFAVYIKVMNQLADVKD